MSKENNTIQLSDGRSLGYAEYGDSGGKPVFFFHGWPGVRLLPRFIDEIAKKQHVRLISVDRPGYGLSSFQNNRTILDWPDDIVELADYLKIKKFAVEGVSGGGPYAAACAYKISERLTKVGIIVGLGPTWIPSILKGMSIMAIIRWEKFMKHAWFRTYRGMYYYFAVKYFPFLLFFAARSNADKKALLFLLMKYRKKILIDVKEICRQGAQGAIWDLYLYTKDWGFDLKNVRTKVYLFYGAQDRNVSVNMGKYYHEHIPNSTLYIYPKEGHIISFTHADEIFQTLA